MSVSTLTNNAIPDRRREGVVPLSESFRASTDT